MFETFLTSREELITYLSMEFLFRAEIKATILDPSEPKNFNKQKVTSETEKQKVF